jgi:hypothetical protein
MHLPPSYQYLQSTYTLVICSQSSVMACAHAWQHSISGALPIPATLLPSFFVPKPITLCKWAAHWLTIYNTHAGMGAFTIFNAKLYPIQHAEGRKERLKVSMNHISKKTEERLKNTPIAFRMFLLLFGECSCAL